MFINYKEKTLKIKLFLITISFLSQFILLLLNCKNITTHSIFAGATLWIPIICYFAINVFCVFTISYITPFLYATITGSKKEWCVKEIDGNVKRKYKANQREFVIISANKNNYIYDISNKNSNVEIGDSVKILVSKEKAIALNDILEEVHIAHLLKFVIGIIVFFAMNVVNMKLLNYIIILYSKSS